MGNVGPSRTFAAFAAFAAAGTIGILAHMLVVNPLAWAVMRMGSGLCLAGCYTIIEAWLQAKVTNPNPGSCHGGGPHGRYRRVALRAAADRGVGTGKL